MVPQASNKSSVSPIMSLGPYTHTKYQRWRSREAKFSFPSLTSSLDYADTLTGGMKLNPQRPAYVPPHMRGQPASAAAAPKSDFHGHAAPPHMNGDGYSQSPTGLPTPAATPTPGGRSAYVPPGQRNGGSAPPTAAQDGGWGGPAPRPQVRSGGGGGGFGGGGSAPPGFGSWKNGHIVGQRNQRMEAELFGTEGDGLHQVSFSPPPPLPMTTVIYD